MRRRCKTESVYILSRKPRPSRTVLKLWITSCATRLCRRWGWAPRSRLAGAGFKPPKAAVVKSHGGERLGKVTAKTVAGVAQRDERKRTIDEASKLTLTRSKLGSDV